MVLSLFFYNILSSQSGSKAKEQCNLSINEVNGISFHFYSPESISKRATLLRLYSEANGPRWVKDIGCHESHSEDDSIPHSSTKDGFHSDVTVQVVNLSQN